MKTLLILSLVLLSVSCKHDRTNKAGYATSISANNFDWLLGNWVRVNEKEGRKTYEKWNKKNNAEYAGFGFTLQNQDTVWQEHIRLLKSEDGWNFEVMGKGATQPTIFKLTKIEKESFTCENMDNDFPTHIRYFTDGKKITAIISGGNREIPFEFERAM